MKKGILATKVGMTQIFQEDGTVVPVTVLQAGPCVVTQVKTEEKDGYNAVQVGFIDKEGRKVNRDKGGRKHIKFRHGLNKPLLGHFEKAGVSGKRFAAFSSSAFDTISASAANGSSCIAVWSISGRISPPSSAALSRRRMRPSACLSSAGSR